MSSSAGHSTPRCCFSWPPDCNWCSACRRSSIWPADRSTRSAPISASPRSALRSSFGMPPLLFFPVLILAGLAIGLVGLPIERVLRTIYRRDESYQLLITFGFLLMFQDVFRYLWGATPRTMDNVYLAYGTANFLGRPGADLQSAGDRGQPGDRGRARPVSRAHQDRAHRARHRRKSRHGRGARRQRLENLRAGVHRRLHARHGRRRAGGAVRRGIARYGG